MAHGLHTFPSGKVDFSDRCSKIFLWLTSRSAIFQCAGAPRPLDARRSLCDLAAGFIVQSRSWRRLWAASARQEAPPGRADQARRRGRAARPRILRSVDELGDFARASRGSARGPAAHRHDPDGAPTTLNHREPTRMHPELDIHVRDADCKLIGARGRTAHTAIVALPVSDPRW
jgi:hypothetical protein